MKIAIISDIHGNYQALKRCLEDSISQDVDAYIWLGDYLGEFPYPQDTMKTLYNMQTRYPCYFLRGNKEDYWINRRKDTFCDWMSDGTLWEAQTAHRFRRFCPLRLCGVT